MTLSLFFTLLGLQDSSALSTASVTRSAMASISNDDRGLLVLEGLDGREYDLDKSYSTVGSITNNTNQTIQLTTRITPDFGLTNNNGYKLSVKIADEVVEFKHKSDSTKQITVKLEPGQRVEVQGALKNNHLAVIVTALDFIAVDSSGTSTMQLNDTLKTPRRFISY